MSREPWFVTRLGWAAEWLDQHLPHRGWGQHIPFRRSICGLADTSYTCGDAPQGTRAGRWLGRRLKSAYSPSESA